MAAEVSAEVGGIVKMQPDGDGLDRHAGRLTAGGLPESATNFDRGISRAN